MADGNADAKPAGKLSFQRNVRNPNYVRVWSGGGSLAKALAAGAPRSTLSAAPFFVSKRLRNMAVATTRGHRIVTRKEQFLDYLALWEDPFKDPYVMCVSARPSETLAVMVGMRLMLRAVDRSGVDGSPRWHSVMGGIAHDPLRDGPFDKDINFLVLSNVPANATAHEVVKLGDVLAKDDGIPRVIVTSDDSPAEFVSE